MLGTFIWLCIARVDVPLAANCHDCLCLFPYAIYHGSSTQNGTGSSKIQGCNVWVFINWTDFSRNREEHSAPLERFSALHSRIHPLISCIFSKRYKQIEKPYLPPSLILSRSNFWLLPVHVHLFTLRLAIPMWKLFWARGVFKYSMSLHLSASFLALENMCLLW